VTKLRELERRLAEEPDNLGLRVALASAMRDAGRRDEALELYRSVAAAYRDQGRAMQAMAVCRSILELAPDDADCQALIADLEATRPGGAAPGLGPELEMEVDAELDPDLTTPVRRRSWSDPTPLPVPLPHHVADPTKRLRKVSESDLPTTLDAPTRPGTEDGLLPEVSGIANAARRISASLIAARARGDEDVAMEFDSRRIPALAAGAPGRFARSSGGVPVETDESDDDLTQPRELPRGAPRTRPGPSTGPRAQGPLAFAFFQPLPEDRRPAVLARFSRRSVPPLTVVIRQGEPVAALVLVSSGRLEVRLERAGEAIELGAIGPGEYIGEAPLLARAPARASVVAATEAELLLLAPRDFYEIAGAFPALWAELKASAERRTRELDGRR
jgi:hypothetical protein